MTDRPSGPVAAEREDLHARLDEAQTGQNSLGHIGAAERLARLILEQSTEAIVVCDEQARVLHASQGAQQFCEGSPLLRSFAEVFSLRSEASGPFHLAPVLQGETLRNVDITLDHQEREFDLLLNAGPLRSGQQIVGCVVTMTNITERKRAEEALRASEEKFRGLFEGTRDAVMTIEPPSWRFTSGNPATVKMFGMKNEEDFLSRGPWELSPDLQPDGSSSAEKSMKAIETAIREGSLLFEWTHRRIGGDEFPADVLLTRMERAGKVILQGTVRDITERKRAEAEQTRVARQLELLLESTIEGICGIDPESRCTFINRAGAAMLGLRPEEVLGRKMHEVTHHHRPDGSVYPEEECPIYRALKTRQCCHVATEVFWRRDGSSFPVEYSASPIMEDGIIRGAVVTYSDITEHRRLEAQFRQSQKLEAVGQLAGGVAHDFNNILAVMMMQTELIGTAENLPEEFQEGLRQIHATVKRAANLTRQLLMFSRKQVMRPCELDLNEVVTSLAKMLQRFIGEDVRLQLDIHQRPLIVHADAGMLDQVLMNLVVNARDAMPGGGRLIIETNETHFTAEEASLIPDAKPGRHVGLRVTDTGCGIAPENLSSIFEPFFTTKEPGKGTGLGLATVFGIVKQHGGSLVVESEVGRGTTFRIFLPAAEVSAVASTKVISKSKPSRGTETILLVEDESAVRMLTRIVLERHGYRVLEAAHGVEALRIWEQHAGPIHLLLTDIVMPEGLGGRELAAQLQERSPKLRALFTSGYSADIAGRGLMLREGQNFLQKPCPPDQLLETVRRCLDG